MVAQADPAIGKAVAILAEMSADEQLRTEAFYRDKALHDYNTLMEEALTEGIEKGIKQGIEKGIKQGIEKGIEQGIEKGIEKGRYEQAQESAVKLKRQQIPLQIIADSLGLTIEEVERL